jgi:hypothetical protein
MENRRDGNEKELHHVTISYRTKNPFHQQNADFRGIGASTTDAESFFVHR